MDKRLSMRGKLLGIFLRFTSKRSFERANALLRFYRRNAPKNINRRQTFLQRPHDGSSMRVVIYKRLTSSNNAAGLLWFHGGGYALGKPEMDEALYGRILRAIDCVIISPDYCLSVNKPFPCAFEDCYAALVWMKDHAKELGIRDDQLFVGGSSAGGGACGSHSIVRPGQKRSQPRVPNAAVSDDRRSHEHNFRREQFVSRLELAQQLSRVAALSRTTLRHGFGTHLCGARQRNRLFPAAARVHVDRQHRSVLR